jgi:hypothetical protein
VRVRNADGEIATCPAAKSRAVGRTGSHPASSKASYRYPRKNTSSGMATRKSRWAAIGPSRGTLPRYGERAGGRGRRTKRRKAAAPTAARSSRVAALLPGSAPEAHEGRPRPRYRGNGA